MKRATAAKKRMMEIVQKEAPYAKVISDDGTDHVVWKCSIEDSAFFSS
jgi:hypothetical protein